LRCFSIQIEFECLGELEDDLEWKVTYVGSANDPTRDQVATNASFLFDLKSIWSLLWDRF
jgi:hypothetical protein